MQKKMHFLGFYGKSADPAELAINLFNPQSLRLEDKIELVAVEKIGAETVTYVPNIYTYSYRLIMEARAEREKAVEKIKGQSK